MKKCIRVGSRKSQLALWQSEFVISLLKERNPEYTFELIPISTKGDKLLDVALSKIGDKGLFTKELENALLENRIDFAVHSMKDIPTVLPEGLIISAITERHDSRDVLISKNMVLFDDLPKGAKVGTSSLRRRSQILNKRPDLSIEDIRGNLNTRLKKMETENFDAIVIAAAGVERLGWHDKITQKLDFSLSLPAVGQGALGIETRENDEEILKVIDTINHPETNSCVTAERSLLRYLEGGCQIPIGAHALIKDGKMFIEAMVASLDGKILIRDNLEGNIEDAKELGITLAEKLKAQGAVKILEEIR
ncbi:hydroxymethylbilane synthase [Desulfonispora thiosulfatigenes DSM 11270]|uniref:Porphobilinogen deaminase n=1 Tax=Desulfonispora thiosulfatigenes DSM 11270 TaxID=656914 RepID=A0A1W1VLK9_DESTI|nr:hydroxymethylbilane synthase [Desulfonispora thiosulfatigenes]SMB94173.1 hydroxymethylbilane synthase [Desulfonispora thiosulfatigenes DSM 11270]